MVSFTFDVTTHSDVVISMQFGIMQCDNDLMKHLKHVECLHVNVLHHCYHGNYLEITHLTNVMCAIYLF